MKLLIYGSGGWIGQQFLEILQTKNIPYNIGLCRVDDTEKLREELEHISPTHVISFIGRTHGEISGKKYSTIDYLEQPGKLKENLRDNLFSPLSLAILCNNLNIHYTYLGTGCIFTYDDDHPFGQEEAG